MTPEAAAQALAPAGYADVGYAKVDLHRRRRQGVPEVVYCPGKTPEQVAGILRVLDQAGQNLLATRATPEVYEHVKREIDGLEYNATGRLMWKITTAPKARRGVVQVVSAGTSDIPVAEEAAGVAEFLGNPVRRTFDAGVAGVHRLFDSLEEIRQARVLVVVAGMEGALASVVGGLVSCPVIAVPTSIGYGANFGGLSALLGMLNSCSCNVAVVNIDNGFGAGVLASLINAE
ncbi:MAG: nickel pincer cofactor biosynthesis protein LarB [Candidatus Sumerlaeota bacterium]|nr:nickel pincer cofactor biosynthesis protein LarB [Candidatus Sumerlaeota bacterium]